MSGSPEIDVTTHRRLAADLFNEVWRLIEKDDRTPAEADAMLHAAHASRYHWGVAGTAVNLVRGEWQVSRVYAVLNRPEPALFHARRSLAICEENGIGDFDIAFAHEAVARALALAGDAKGARTHAAIAADLGANISEDDDREIFFNDLATVPGYAPAA